MLLLFTVGEAMCMYSPVSNIKNKDRQNSGYSISNHVLIVFPKRYNQCQTTSFFPGYGTADNIDYRIEE